jgi:hypothetical protein
MDFVAGFVPDGQQFLGDDGLGWSVKSLSKVLFMRWSKVEGAESGSEGRIVAGKVAGRRESGLQVFVRVADFWVGFLLGWFRDAGILGGGWASGPWTSDTGAGGFCSR